MSANPDQCRVRIDDILKIVGRHFNVARTDLLSPRRARSIVVPRQIGMYLAKKMTSRSLPEIGRRFGGRDHSTVLHAVRKIEDQIKTDESAGTPGVPRSPSAPAPSPILWTRQITGSGMRDPVPRRGPFTVTCWEGQSPHLQVTALAFFASRPGRPSVLGTVDLGARSFWSVPVVRSSRCGEAGEVITKAGDETGGASAGRDGRGAEVLQPTSGGRPSAELRSEQDLSPLQRSPHLQVVGAFTPEPIRLAHSPGVAMSVRPVLPLRERRWNARLHVTFPQAAITALVVPEPTRVAIATTRPFAWVFFHHGVGRPTGGTLDAASGCPRLPARGGVMLDPPGVPDRRRSPSAGPRCDARRPRPPPRRPPPSARRARRRRPTGPRCRRRRGRGCPHCGLRQGRRGRSPLSSWRRRPMSHRTGPCASGEKRHQVVVPVAGLLAGPSALAADRAATDVTEPTGECWIEHPSCRCTPPRPD